MRVLVVSNMYPSASNPKFGSFVADAVRAMERHGAQVAVVANSRHEAGRLSNALKYLVFAIRVLAAAARGGYDVVHAHYLTPSGVLGAFAASVRGVPLVVFSHGSDVLLRAWRWPVGALTAAAVSAADALVVPSAHHEQWVRDVFGGDARRIEVVPVGVDTDVFAPGDRRSSRAVLGVDPSVALVAFLGALDANKGAGCARLIEALAASPLDGVRLLVAGQGPRDGALRALVERLGMTERVEFRPFGGRDEVLAVLRAADVVAVPSLRESLGLVALEAQAVGTPVVAFRVGGLPEHVVPGVSGELVDPDDADGLRRALGEVLARPDRYAPVFDARRWGLEATGSALMELSASLVESRRT